MVSLTESYGHRDTGGQERSNESAGRCELWLVYGIADGIGGQGFRQNAVHLMVER